MRKLVSLAAVSLSILLGQAEVSEAARTKTNFAASQDTAKPKKTKRKVAVVSKKIKPRALAAARAKPRRSTAGCTNFFQCVFSTPGSSSRGVSVFGGKTRQKVDWNEARYKPGSIVVRTSERALYLVLPDGEAYRYKVGVGREGFQWSGNSRIGWKQEWPGWTPPAEMIRREAAKGHILPEYMEGGPGNPLGARALYISGTLFRIHGTNNAASIGGAVSSGCIRMMNSDVVDLYDRARVGARVYVQH